MQRYENSTGGQGELQLKNAETAALRMEMTQLKMELGMRRQEHEDQALKIMVSGVWVLEVGLASGSDDSTEDAAQPSPRGSGRAGGAADHDECMHAC
jgi:hypothetical protein